MLKNFKAYQLSVRFYKECEKIRGPRHLIDQLARASSSVTLNLAEGSEGITDKNRRRFYRMSMASLRESQALLNLLSSSPHTKEAERLGDETGACIFGLIKALNRKLNTTGTES